MPVVVFAYMGWKRQSIARGQGGLQVLANSISLTLKSLKPFKNQELKRLMPARSRAE